jgi:hypothetical protein
METATIPARELIVNAAAEAAVVEPVIAQAPTTAPISAPAPANSFWLWMSLLLACGWILNALYWWYKLRKLGTVSILSVSKYPDLRGPGKKLQQACNDSDAIAARQVLLTWGRALLAPREINSLHQLGNAMGADLRHEIEVLNQSLYAPDAAEWRGQALWSICQQLEKDSLAQRNQNNAGLSPLNPAP